MPNSIDFPDVLRSAQKQVELKAKQVTKVGGIYLEWFGAGNYQRREGDGAWVSSTTDYPKLPTRWWLSSPADLNANLPYVLDAERAVRMALGLLGLPMASCYAGINAYEASIIRGYAAIFHLPISELTSEQPRFMRKALIRYHVAVAFSNDARHRYIRP